MSEDGSGSDGALPQAGPALRVLKFTSSVFGGTTSGKLLPSGVVSHAPT